jgi:cytidylate kinase
MFSTVTIAREYGSGGAEIGRKVAALLNWELVDKQIIERAASLARVDAAWAASLDEHALTWWEKVLRSFRKGGPDLLLEDCEDLCADRDTMQRFTARVIEEAARVGNCVIIGRGAGCFLRHQSHVLRVLVCAPLTEKIERIKSRHPDAKDLRALLARRDAERTSYAQTYYGWDPADPRIYHLCLNSTLGFETCGRLIANLVQSVAPEVTAETRA